MFGFYVRKMGLSTIWRVFMIWRYAGRKRANLLVDFRRVLGGSAISLQISSLFLSKNSPVEGHLTILRLDF